MRFVFVADFFVNQILGGGEINNEELISILRQQGHEVKTINSHLVSLSFLQEYDSYNFIVSNFINLSEESKAALLDKKYIIYEHDHKYLRTRNPASYKDFLAPKEEIVNFKFYESAKAIFCQSDFHKGIVEKNLNLKNVISVGGNLWSLESLELMENLSRNRKDDACSILKSNIEHKNTIGALRFCQIKNLGYELIEDSNYHNFLKKLGSNEKFVFLPQTPETLSRVVVEARMMGATVITNNLVGATKEHWFALKGPELIKIIKNKRKEIPQKVIEFFSENTSNS